MNDRPTQQQKIILLANELEKQVTDPTHTDGRIKEILGFSNGAYYRWKPKALAELQRRQSVQAKALDDTITRETEEAVKIGLKSKLDRVLILQEQVDRCLSELEGDSSFQYVVVNKEVKKVTRALTVHEKTKLRNTIATLQSEISKIQGDYAPNKVAPTDPDGQPLPPPQQVLFYLPHNGRPNPGA